MVLHEQAEAITAAFDAAFDHAIVFHGYADHLRDYDIVVQLTADPSTGILEEFVLYRFRHCVSASATTAVAPATWARSLDDGLLDPDNAADLDGYVWGVRWQCLYPGMRLLDPSAAAQQWSEQLGIPMHHARIETNGHNLELIFSGLEVRTLEPGWAPFTVPAG